MGLFEQATKSSLFENQINSRVLQLKDSLQSLLTQVKYINELDPDVAAAFKASTAVSCKNNFFEIHWFNYHYSAERSGC